MLLFWHPDPQLLLQHLYLSFLMLQSADVFLPEKTPQALSHVSLLLWLKHCRILHPDSICHYCYFHFLLFVTDQMFYSQTVLIFLLHFQNSNQQIPCLHYFLYVLFRSPKIYYLSFPLYRYHLKTFVHLTSLTHLTQHQYNPFFLWQIPHLGPY